MAIIVIRSMARVVRIVDIQIQISPFERICTIDNTDAKMDTIPKIVMMLITVSLRARSVSAGVLQEYSLCY